MARPDSVLCHGSVDAGTRRRSSTNSLMAEDRLLCWRERSMSATMFDSVTRWLCAMSFKPRQNASSRLTLVLCPASTIERLTMGDFIFVSFCKAQTYQQKNEFAIKSCTLRKYIPCLLYTS